MDRARQLLAEKRQRTADLTKARSVRRPAQARYVRSAPLKQKYRGMPMPSPKDQSPKPPGVATFGRVVNHQAARKEKAEKEARIAASRR